MDGVKKQMGLPVGGGAATSCTDQVGGGGQVVVKAGEEVTGERKKKKKRKERSPAPGDTTEVADDSNNPMEQVAAAMRRRNEAQRRPPGSTPAPAIAPVSQEENGDETRRLAKSGWESAMDPSSGRAYFFNRRTGQRSWTNPLQSAASATATRSTLGSALGVAPSSAAKDQVTATGERPKDGDTEALPVGWKSAKDPKSGKVYFHHNSGKTSWERPTA